MIFKIVRFKANLALFLTALIWGTTFVAQKTAMDNMGPFTFNGLRCLIGAFSLFIIGFFIKDDTKRKRSKLIEGGAFAGSLLFLALTLQQAGIVSTSAGHAGFVSSLYIIFVPLFSLLSGKKISANVWLGIMLALVGLYFLCVKDGFSIGQGDITVSFSAIFFALHIICISKYSKKTNPIHLSSLQFLFAGLFSMFSSFLVEKITLNGIVNSTTELFCAGVLSCAVAFTLQISAQRHVKPYIASLILSLESVFAVLAGYFILNEVLTLKEIIGCVIMFIALYLAENKKPYIQSKDKKVIKK